MWGWRGPTWGVEACGRELRAEKLTRQGRAVGGKPCLSLFQEPSCVSSWIPRKRCQLCAQTPVMTPAIPRYRRFVAACSNGLRGLCDFWCSVEVACDLCLGRDSLYSLGTIIMAGKGTELQGLQQERVGFTAEKQGAAGEWNVMIRAHLLEESLSE